MQLIYRAHTFMYVPGRKQASTRSTAVNWRYRIPGQTVVNTVLSRSVCPPQVINWRYQLPLEA